LTEAAVRQLAIRVAVLAAAAAYACGCDSNFLESGEEKDPPEDATIALENHDPAKALSILDAALASDPANPQLLSIKALALAQRAGIEPLSLVQQLAAKGTNAEAASTSDRGGLIALFDVMPAATASAMEDVNAAVDILARQIAPEDRLPGDDLKLAIFQTAALVLPLKALDTNHDGTLSLDEIAALSDTSAEGLINALSSAAAAFGADSGDAGAKAAAMLASHKADIDAAPGDTPSEKLKNYLAAKSGSGVDTGLGTDTSTFAAP
jgi:hypothetical protein